MSDHSHDQVDTSQLTTADLLVILDVTRRMAEQHLVQPLLEYIATHVFEIVPAERCMIVLFQPDGNLDIQIARLRQGDYIETAPDQISYSILKRVQTTLTPLVINDALSDKSLRSASSVFSLGIRSVLCVPLVSYGQAIGAIYLENRSARGKFREEHMMPMILFSHQAVVAIENARMYENLQAQLLERQRAL